MLTHPKLLRKLALAVSEYLPLRFQAVGSFDMELAETTAHYRTEPTERDGLKWRPVKPGTRWGGSGVTGWFRGDFTVPESAAGSPLFLQFEHHYEPMPLIIEALLIVDGQYKGVLNPKHTEVQIFQKAKAGTRHHVAIEAYSGHTYPSTQPHDKPVIIEKNSKVFGGARLVVERPDVSAFVYDMQVLLRLVDVLDQNSLRHGEMIRTLQEAWTLLPALPSELAEEEWRPALARVRKIIAPLLAKTNGPTAPTINVVAHSHLDTAWLWTIAETRRKCARTFSSMVNLLGRFPEVVFFQSAPCHADFVRQDYPALFEEIKKLVKAGRWEPNGAAWIEPDCNLIGGEALIRQFLTGIRWTREHFNYSPDTFWQPDVFGYCAALPQILRGCGIQYFCTTKMAWNDTTRFPYDTFHWQGIDGSRVLSHLNSLPQSIDSDDVVKLWNWAQHKDSEERRLASYGWGDGGGGPTAEDMEKIRRMRDLEGMPKVEYTTVSGFMQALDGTERPWPVWVGELYLEGHRGTLTSMAAIKRGNRLTELRLRDAEYLHSVALNAACDYPHGIFQETWRKLLINQFHDILPGTSIAEANRVALREFKELQAASTELVDSGARSLVETTKDSIAIFNTLSWTRQAVLELHNLPAKVAPNRPGLIVQTSINIDDENTVLVSGLTVPPLAAISVPLSAAPSSGKSSFKFKGLVLETPHARIKFNRQGSIVSWDLKAEERELCIPGNPLNSFLMGEDVPDMWDNWDIDVDQERLLKPAARLASREIVADGPLEMRIRSVYNIGKASRLTQDIVVRQDSPGLRFDTRVDWKERHQLLKVALPVDVHAESAKHEIQFGHLDRPTHRNLPQDRARFEVCCHKWSDLSDGGFGVALLNDCKYGISVLGSEMRLTLIKSGTHPDPCADNGDHHRFSYMLLPHSGSFSVESVVRPAYELNTPLVLTTGLPKPIARESMMKVSAPNVIVETVKRSEVGSDIIVRLYEAGRSACHCLIEAPWAASIAETNMLEEIIAEARQSSSIRLWFRPFEIKTLRLKRR